MTKFRPLAAAAVILSAVTSPTDAQGILRMESGSESYTFQVVGDRWASIIGLEFEYRVRHGTLLGEPWVNSNFKYWYWGQHDEANRVHVMLHRVQRAPLHSGESPISETAEYIGSIRLWGMDEVAITENSSGSFDISYPFDRFVELVRVTHLDFVATKDGAMFVGPFSGVMGKPDEWGWNFPGSPSWDALLVDAIRSSPLAPISERRVSHYSADYARSFVRDWREECQPICDGQVIDVQELRINLLPVITDIAAHSPAFAEAFFATPKTAQVATLVGAVPLESDVARRAQRQRLAQMALDAFRSEIDPALLAHWESTVHRDQGGAEAYAASEVAMCELETEGRASPRAVAALEEALQRPGLHPAVVRRGRAALPMLRRGGLGTGDVQITLTWDNGADLDLYVTEPGGTTISYNNRSSPSGGKLDVDDTNGFGPENVFWARGTAPRGQYRVEVDPYDDTPSNFTVRVLNGRQVSEHRGYASTRTTAVTFSFDGTPTTQAASCTRLTQ